MRLRLTDLHAPAWALGVAGLLMCVSARAAPPVQMPMPPPSLEALTWPELKARISAGSTTVLLPIGGTEQNGPHIALGKHNQRVRLLADKIAHRLGDTIVAPVVAYVPEGRIDPPTEHMRWPGTISLPVPVFEATLEAAARSFRQHGFRDIVLLGDHGGYAASLERVAARLNHEWRADPRARVHALPEYYRAAPAPYAEALKARGLSTAQIGSHAGLADTSLMLALDASLVRADLAAARDPAARGDGVVGDPRRSSAEFGQLGVERIVEASVLAIRARVAAAR
jgi:creatinine amidohydrolase/Fe(II)-dependent formamide hydrolase-like protein